MEHKEYWKLLTRYLSNDYPRNEQVEFDEKLKTDKAFEKFFREMKYISSVKQKPLKIKTISEKRNELKTALAKSSSETKVERKKRTYRKNRFWGEISPYQRVFRYAAVFIAAAGLSIYFASSYISSNSKHTESEFRHIIVNHGERITINLTDGTFVTIDAGSELKYPAEFGNTRDVYLKGEAYFRVAHNRNIPFRVFAKKARIKVIGTEFNVRAWKENSDVTVTVKDGKVALGSSQERNINEVTLASGEQSVLSKQGKLLKPAKVNADEYTKWMQNEIHFQDASLNEILAQLERWYDFRFEVVDSIMQIDHLDVHLKRTNVDNVIELLSIITKTKVYRDGKKIRFLKK